MAKPKVYVDFQNADTKGRLRLNCVGTVQDLSHQKIELKESLKLMLYSEDLRVVGRVEYSAEESLWVAVIDWDAIEGVGAEVNSAEDQVTEANQSA